MDSRVIIAYVFPVKQEVREGLVADIDWGLQQSKELCVTPPPAMLLNAHLYSTLDTHADID